MADKITFDDKVSLTTNSLPRANKCTDDDLNEIKEVVNNNADELNYIENYSRVERRIGTWVDHKPIYRRVISATTANEEGTWKKISNNANIDKIIGYSGYIVSAGIVKILPFSSPYQSIWFSLNDGDILEANSGASFSNQPLTLVVEYTKTTD